MRGFGAEVYVQLEQVTINFIFAPRSLSLCWGATIPLTVFQVKVFTLSIQASLMGSLSLSIPHSTSSFGSTPPPPTSSLPLERSGAKQGSQGCFRSDEGGSGEVCAKWEQFGSTKGHAAWKERFGGQGASGPLGMITPLQCCAETICSDTLNILRYMCTLHRYSYQARSSCRMIP